MGLHGPSWASMGLHSASKPFACALWQACACVLALLLRRRLVGRADGRQPALTVHAALAVFEGLAE